MKTKVECECGCKVVSAFLCGNTIDYCPLHKAAPKLYEALRKVMNDYPLAHYTGNNHPCTHCTALKALAEVDKC